MKIVQRGSLLKDFANKKEFTEACRRGDYSNAGQAEKLMELWK